MSMNRIADLQCKEVINISTGMRLGYVSDIEIDIICGNVVAIVVPSLRPIWSFFSRGEEYIVPWSHIERIGGDIILVRHSESPRPCERRERRWF